MVLFYDSGYYHRTFFLAFWRFLRSALFTREAEETLIFFTKSEAYFHKPTFHTKFTSLMAQAARPLWRIVYSRFSENHKR